ncbi:hypothetical protein HDU80_000677 [Chytriomyces hyalinus]|nr:hypothetical protein HDU80_000677 [Chytriomyces hyalinus]
MPNLPIEVLLQIFLLLDPFRIAKYRRVCRCFNNVLTGRRFTNLVGLVHIGHIHNTWSSPNQDVFCFVTPASFGERFLTTLQEHMLNSGVFTNYPVDTLHAAPINHLTATNRDSLFESLPCAANGTSENFRLVGPLPSTIGSLEQLSSLDFSFWDMLSGPIPQSLGHLKKLTNLSSIGRRVTGPILSDLANLDSLKILNLCNTPLNETIPDSFGNLINLEALDVSNTSLTGPIPASFRNLVNLVELHLGSNKLSGKVPDMFGEMSKLKRLLLGRNHLEGRIPGSISQCMQLELLDCRDNRVSGSLIDLIFQLPSLRRNSNCSPSLLISASAEFVGMEAKQLTQIITGTVSQSQSAALDPQSLNVASNQRETENYITSLKNMKNLQLTNNILEGPFPSEIGQLTKLKTLSLGRNQFSGVIPDSISSLVKLVELDLAQNLFVGSILDSIIALVNLKFLYLGHNEFCGQLPAEIGDLTSLEVLDLSHNRFCGTIPFQSQ